LWSFPKNSGGPKISRKPKQQLSFVFFLFFYLYGIPFHVK